MIFLVTPALFGAFDLTGLEIVGTTEGYPAELAGLTEGDILIAIDSVSTLNYKEFSTTMASKVPGDTVAFQLEDRTIEITATQNPNNLELAHFGFSYQPELEPTKWYSGLLLSFSKFLNWFFILSLGIGLFNLLPIPILDGGKMLHDGLFGIVKNKKRASKIFMYLSFFSIALLIGAILLPFIA
jgi:membrane-associated protease RseP (regulator of RpoE activity)